MAARVVGRGQIRPADVGLLVDMERDSSMLGGLLLVDKPAGISSARAVDRVKRALASRTRVGHAGTLDPFATGLLLILVGKATRSCEAMMSLPKTYLATVRLGATTETDDPESPERPWPDCHRPDEARIREALRGLVGPIMQRPPIYSAIKVRGKRACDRTRQGQVVKLEPRRVVVHRLELLRYDWPELDLLIECGRGTYIRSLARDLGESLQTGGYLTALRRTRIGPYEVEQAMGIDQLTPERVSQGLMPL
jgi:tRNA pseudouridine55 synthase